MGFPQSFRDMVSVLYTEPELRMKVNGVVGAPFKPLNGVKQGCALSPLLYIISLQPLLDAIEAPSSAVPGVRVPGTLARGHVELRSIGYADDVSLFVS